MFRCILLLSVIFFVAGALELPPDLKECTPTINMIDASGKIPNGVLSANLLDLGNFDQCLKPDKSKNKTNPILGKYCMVKLIVPFDNVTSNSPFQTFGNFYLNFPKPKSHNIQKRAVIQGMDPTDNTKGFVLGWCVPKNCSISNLTAFLDKYLNATNPKLGIKPLFGGLCQTEDDLKNEYTTGNIIIITFFGITLFIMTISTIYDMLIRSQKKKPAHILLIAFSVRTNGQKLLSTSKNSEQLSCLHGIRFISMMWVVYGHRFASTMMSPIDNMGDLGDWLHNAANMYLMNAPVSVDTFFVLSGLLVGYGYCLAKDKGMKFNIILYYLHRYLRLTPVLAVLVWAHATIVDFFGSGPFWPLLMQVLKNFCIDYWWSPLVYAQNYYNNEEMCMGHTWYLSVDMQLFVLSPIILIPLWKWPKQTLIISFLLVLGSMAIGFVITYVDDLPAFSINTAGDQKYMTHYYYATHARFGPWLMGLMLGYYLYKTKLNSNYKIPLHPAQVAFGWIVGMGLLLTTIFAGHDLLFTHDKLAISFFNGMHRQGWALGLCWVIFACVEGYGGPVNTFLSWSVFQVLGRLTYTIYLVHLSAQYMMLGASKNISHFTDFHNMYLFWGDFALALAISTCLTLAYESPMVTIEKVLFKKGTNSNKPELPVHSNPSTSAQGQPNPGFIKD